MLVTAWPCSIAPKPAMRGDAFADAWVAGSQTALALWTFIALNSPITTGKTPCFYACRLHTTLLLSPLFQH